MNNVQPAVVQCELWPAEHC